MNVIRLKYNKEKNQARPQTYIQLTTLTSLAADKP